MKRDDNTKISGEKRIVDQESPFELHELFFSVTDPKGIIQSFNDVFQRVGEYEAEELHQQPHNVIRHPHMPRSVFRLFWEHLQAGKNIAAYVKNRSKTGKYYWVMAFVCPVPNGYLSVRIKPSSDLFEKVKSLYAEMLQIEQDAKARGASSREVMDCGTAHLNNTLQSLGFDDYKSFMHDALVTEMISRNALLASQSKTLEREAVARRDGTFSDMLAESEATDHALAEIFEHIGVLRRSIEAFHEVRTNVSAVSGNVHRLAMNATIQASSLGEEGRAISILAKFLGDGSRELLDQVQRLHRMGDGGEDLMPRVLSLMFDIAVSKLQIEMIVNYLSYQCKSDKSTSSTSEENGQQPVSDDRIDVLMKGFSDSANRLSSQLDNVRERFCALYNPVNDVMRCSKQLSFVHVTGRVEAVRLPAGYSFGQILESVSGHLESAGNSLQNFTSEYTNVLESLESCDAPASRIDAFVMNYQAKGQFSDASLVGVSKQPTIA